MGFNSGFKGLIYSEQSIVTPPKIFTLPPEMPCIWNRSKDTHAYITAALTTQIKRI